MSMWSPHGVYGVYMQSIWSPPGVHMESTWSCTKYNLKDFIHFFTSPMWSCDQNLNIVFKDSKTSRYSNIIIYSYSTIYIHTLAAKNGLLIYNNIN